MRLNWFSPLPPERSGIAGFTADLLPELARHADVSVYVEQSSWEATVGDNVEVVRYALDSPPWAQLNDADATVFNIGNHPGFHTAMWLLSRQHPGIVILHDLALQHLFADHYGRRGEQDHHVDAIRRHYGVQAGEQARAYWAGRMDILTLAQRYPLTELALERGLAAVTHSADGLRRLRRTGQWTVVYAPLPYRPAERSEATSTPRATEGPLRLVMFGHIGANRRLEVLLEALAGMPDVGQFRLDVYGALADHERIASEVEALSLGHVVRLHGFVPDSTLADALDGADVALNLRFPTMGEASLSQLQIWEHSLPSIVTRTGWYATLPEDAVAFVELSQEVHDLRRHLRRMRDPGLRARMGAAGRHKLEEHHWPGDYVRTLLALVERAPDLHVRRVAHGLAERAGDHLAVWAEGEALRVAAGHVGEKLATLLSDDAPGAVR